MPTKPWLRTATEIKKVLSISEDGRLCLGGEPITDNQLANLKSEVGLIEKMTVWPILLETCRQKAIATGINTSTSFENVLTAKSMLFLLDWMREWSKAIMKVPIRQNLPKTEV
jgi:hypothetical protein